MAAIAQTQIPASDPAHASAEEDDFVPSLDALFVCKDYDTTVYHIGDVEQALDSLHAASTDFDLTGQVVWMVSILSAWYVASIGDRLAGRDVIELGSGAGLMGLVASHFAKSVVLTDNEEEILRLLDRNLRHVPRTCAASVQPLSWGSDGDHARLEATTTPTTFPFVIGADIVYWSACIEPLFNSVARLLARPGGVFALGYYNRNGAMRTRMLAAAAAAGLAWRVVPVESFLPSPPPAALAPFIPSMTLYEFTWRDDAAAAAAAAEVAGAEGASSRASTARRADPAVAGEHGAHHHSGDASVSEATGEGCTHGGAA